MKSIKDGIINMDIKLGHESICPFGKYKGYKMKDIPPHYLIYIYENNLVNKQTKRYIAENIHLLKNKL